MLRGFPIFLNVATKKTPLIIGSSALMSAKTRTILLRAPHVEVATDHIDESLHPLIEEGCVTIRKSFNRWTLCPALLGRPLILVDPDNEAYAAKISRIAHKMGVPVNVPDLPDLCSFALASIVDRDPVTVAIGTEGSAPILATQIRANIEQELHPELGKLAIMANAMREEVAEKLKPGIQRRKFWKQFFTGTVSKLFFDGKKDEAQKAAQNLLAEEAAPQKAEGRVYLIGAGPGDPDLLTIKAVRALKEADVVLYDRLPGSDILSLARREAELVNVGKSKGKASLKQHEIQELIVKYAKKGNIVARLKGGDPSIFARGGEELEHLHAEKIKTEVIPGITTASAAAASLQIPLTHRDLARTVTLLSGHAPDTGEADFGALNLEAFETGKHTLIVYMGASRTKEFATRLLNQKWAPTTPVIIIQSVSHKNERRIKTDLQTLMQDHEGLNLDGPALILCGEVAGLPIQGAFETLALMDKPLHSNQNEEENHGA